MDKVKLPKEVADAIEQVRLNYKTGIEFDLDFIEREEYGKMPEIIRYTGQSRENLQRYFEALVNGYEVEETPEDVFKRFLAEIDVTHMDDVIKAIGIFGIKIEGVNA